MIRIGKIFNVFVLLLFISGCVPVFESNLPGIYIGQNYTNNIDTLIVKEEGDYEHIFHRKKDNKFIKKYTGSWSYSNGRIVFYNFFLNQNDEFNYDLEKWDEVLYTSASLPIKRKGNLEINIIVDYDKNYYYKKIDGNTSNMLLRK